MPEPSAPATAGIQTRQAQSELHEFLHAQRERRRLFPRALLVGLSAGVVAVLFRAALAGGDALRNWIVSWARAFPALGWTVPVLFGGACAGLSVWGVRRWAPEAAGSGIPHLEAVLHRHRDFPWRRVLWAKFVGSALAIGGGMTLGREGPTVQMGGAAGFGVARGLKSGTREALVLAAAGAGAGLAAAFNAPLAGLVFVLEELQRDFRPNVFGAAFIAAAAADIVTRLAGGQLPVFSVPSYPTPALTLLPAFGILGVVVGVFGVGFNRALLGSLNGFARIPASRRVLAASLVGAVVGLVAFFAPQTVGGGHSIAEGALTASVALAAIPALLALRFTLTVACYSTGAPGGIFAPLLVLGALLGLGIGDLTALALPHAGVQPGSFAVVGMAACFTGIVRAPLTGIVLIAEMTSSYALMLPLLVACLCAYAVAERIGDLPIYESLLQRDLLSGGTLAAVGEPMVLEIEVKVGSRFDGLSVRELGLPAGVVLVSCREAGREWVPDASTVLHAPVRVTAVVSPQSEDGLERLRDGCGG
ncbi:MAG: H(+)/Cl(-) exchange transporter ClcA [Fimbriimonas sp.]